MPAATSPFATARTSARNSAAVTSSHDPPRRRENTTASGASAALTTTSTVRLPVEGISTWSGEENSRTPGGYRRGVGPRSDRLAGPAGSTAVPATPSVRGGRGGRPDRVVDRHRGRARRRDGGDRRLPAVPGLGQGR